MRERFDRAHGERYDFRAPERPVEVVTVEVRAVVPAVPLAPAPNRARSAAAARTPVVVQGRRREVPVHDFDAMGSGRVSGPALVMQSGATLWVGPGWSGTRASGGALVLRRGRGR
jgi:N-methylhydantoinase A/oxoprolinase/acetone carboxylase beta subunit